MKTTILMLSLSLAALGSTAMADFNLANSQKSVTCFGDDDQSFVLNAGRTTVKSITEGESLGPQKITNRQSDGDTFVSYTTSEGTLTLSDRGDEFQPVDSQDSMDLHCQ